MIQLLKDYLTNKFFVSIDDYINRDDVSPYDVYINEKNYITLWTHLPFEKFKGNAIPITSITRGGFIEPAFFSIREEPYAFIKCFPKGFPSTIKGVLDYR